MGSNSFQKDGEFYFSQPSFPKKIKKEREEGWEEA